MGSPLTIPPAAHPNTAVVTLNGLDIEGSGTGTNGIQFISGSTLHVHKTQIRDFANNGISLTPSGGPAKVTVATSYITDNGSSVSNAGILVKPTGGSSVNLSVNDTQFESNRNGIFMDACGGGGPCNMSVNHSVPTTSVNNGIAVASTGGTAFNALVSDSMISLNAGAGAAAAGSGATLLLGGNSIAENITGVSNAGGTVRSFKNNQISANGSNGSPIAAVPGGPLN